MSNKKTLQKLELTWIGKGEEPKLEPRILIENPEYSYGDPSSENMLIHGDNLLALKALEQDYTGKVKCIYIDPPFNTGEAFEHYEDGVEHSIWLNLMRKRSLILHKLLSKDGTLFVHIDDNELGYLLVLLDEVFGRDNRIGIVTFKQGSATGHKAINPGIVTTCNYLLIYTKHKSYWKPNRVYTARLERDSRYNKVIINYDEHYSKWKFKTLNDVLAEPYGIPGRLLKKKLGSKYEETVDEYVLQNSEKVIRPARPDYSSVGQSVREMIDMSKEKRDEVLLLERSNHPDMYFFNGERLLFYKHKLKMIDGDVVSGEPLTNLWDDLLSNNLHKEGNVSFPKGKKPEFLIKRVLDLTTKENDLVLDSFLGSGTTAAVAHKMRRRWIGIELGEHAQTHCKPRMKQVVDGEQDGISKAVNWQGGGGFKFYTLAPSLLKQDKFGNWVISQEYNADMLAAAMAKQEGFKYQPHDSIYWKQGQSSEHDFIFTTTNSSR
ncbi:MAG: site-specific DNA-methyltransferase [Saprospiraceae bacterium]